MSEQEHRKAWMENNFPNVFLFWAQNGPLFAGRYTQSYPDLYLATYFCGVLKKRWSEPVDFLFQKAPSAEIGKRSLIFVTVYASDCAAFCV